MVDLTATVRSAAAQLERGSESNAKVIMEPVRAALAERGLAPGCHVREGADGPALTAEQAVEWYAGQGVSLVDNEAWFAINSWLNCLDKFAPEKP